MLSYLVLLQNAAGVKGQFWKSRGAGENSHSPAILDARAPRETPNARLSDHAQSKMGVTPSAQSNNMQLAEQVHTTVRLDMHRRGQGYASLSPNAHSSFKSGKAISCRQVSVPLEEINRHPSRTPIRWMTLGKDRPKKRMKFLILWC